MNLDKSRVVNYLKKRHIKIDKMRKAVDRFACRANRSAQNSEAADAADLFDSPSGLFYGLLSRPTHFYSICFEFSPLCSGSTVDF